MTVRELAQTLNLEILTGEAGLGQEVEHGYVSDLLSDVIGNALENSVWITVQRAPSADGNAVEERYSVYDRLMIGTHA